MDCLPVDPVDGGRLPAEEFLGLEQERDREVHLLLVAVDVKLDDTGALPLLDTELDV